MLTAILTTWFRYLKNILDCDLRTYGEHDIDELADVSRTESQVEIDAVTTNNLADLEPPSDEE